MPREHAFDVLLFVTRNPQPCPLLEVVESGGWTPTVAAGADLRTEVDQVVRICSAMPGAHGAPVHVGDPAVLGIADLQAPDYGDPVQVGPGEVPVFWACGVTPQNALRRSRLPFAVTHAPGHMVVTDLAAAPAGAGLTASGC